MIRPDVRASFGREELDWLIEILAGGDPDRRREWEERLQREGPDSLLDDPRTCRALLDRSGVELVPSRLALYILLRRALLDADVERRVVADYVTALVYEFGLGDRSRRIAEHDDEEYRYLVDLVEALTRAEGRRAFLLQAHLGNFALWLSGLFPDFILSRVQRKGGPGLGYYEELGSTGFRMAADARAAREHSLDEVYRETADAFRSLRRALNRVSDDLFFPRPAAPVERLIRQARDGLTDRDLPH